jgi:hypothetical protein
MLEPSCIGRETHLKAYMKAKPMKSICTIIGRHLMNVRVMNCSRG